MRLIHVVVCLIVTPQRADCHTSIVYVKEEKKPACEFYVYGVIVATESWSKSADFCILLQMSTKRRSEPLHAGFSSASRIWKLLIITVFYSPIVRVSSCTDLPSGDDWAPIFVVASAPTTQA